MNEECRGRRSRLMFAGAALLISLAAVGCSDSLDASRTMTPAATAGAELNTANGEMTEVVIEFTADGFAPEEIDAAEGSRVMMRNSTDGAVTILVQGRDDANEEVTVEPGESVDLGLTVPGAYVLTLDSDPQMTVGVFIS